MLSHDYIVRIYRYGKQKPRDIVGTVEEVGIEGKKPFASLEELWEIVTRTKDSAAAGELPGKKANVSGLKIMKAFSGNRQPNIFLISNL